MSQVLIGADPGRDDHRSTRSFYTQIMDQSRHGLRWSDNDGKVGHTGNIRYSAIAAMAGDLVMFRVDRPDFSLKSSPDYILDNHPAKRSVAIRRTNNRKRAWIDRMVKVANAHGPHLQSS
ncbi:hypothetical protein T190_30100 [Sinorhizobium meliloti CCBAU 01290]|nr:hypothetical protein T190_30100 [Sinorhizobium meliloti CCBAU 01290]